VRVLAALRGGRQLRRRRWWPQRARRDLPRQEVVPLGHAEPASSMTQDGASPGYGCRRQRLSLVLRLCATPARPRGSVRLVL
jgi:hypothetical protein